MIRESESSCVVRNPKLVERSINRQLFHADFKADFYQDFY
jgi:hypothetical protein